MVLWVDKYRPKSLDELTYHSNITERLSKMVSSGQVPHLLFFGPAGAGKKTRIYSLLRAIFGIGATRVKVEQRKFKVNRSKSIDVTTLASNYHIEMTPSDAGRNDTHVIQTVIKELAQMQNVNQIPYKIVILNDVDHLTARAQHALRRTMEKYVATCRLILCCESVCRVIAPLRSRCVPVRIPSPSPQQIVDVLTHVATKEKLTLPLEFAQDIALQSRGNLRRAVLMLEASKVRQYPFTPEMKAMRADWERFVDDLANVIIEEQSPARLLLARNKLYELIANCIPPETILTRLVQSLMKRLDDELKYQTVHWAAHYEHSMQKGSKPIFHLEAFVAKFMSLYKRWVVETFGG